LEGTQTNSITEVTRRDIQRLFCRQGISWSGDLDDVEFLNRLYNLRRLPSTDRRFDSCEGDIWQHRINNFDWDNSWVFGDERLQLDDGADEVLLRFLAESVHPLVREDREQARQIVADLNELLAPDGWELAEVDAISGRPVFGARRLDAFQHVRSSAMSVAQKVDADYVHRQINRMTAAVDVDPDLAIGTAKELIETICRTILDSRGKAVTDKPELLPLARRAMEELKLVPDGISDEVKGSRTIKSILGNLAAIVQGLGELRNLYGTGHGKSGKVRGLTGRHARLAVGAASTLAAFLMETHEGRQE
jgi:hypothetical protein